MAQNNYTALATLQGCSYRSMEERFSYWAVIGIILWCMNNIDNTDPDFHLIPPDTEEVLSAMETALLPSLYACLFMTMYENNFRFYWPDTRGAPNHIAVFRTLLEKEYQLSYNDHLASEVNDLLTPLRETNGGPIPDWALTALTRI